MGEQSQGQVKVIPRLNTGNQHKVEFYCSESGFMKKLDNTYLYSLRILSHIPFLNVFTDILRVTKLTRGITPVLIDPP